MGGSSPEGRRDPGEAERQRSSVGEVDHGFPVKSPFLKMPNKTKKDKVRAEGRGGAAQRGAGDGSAVIPAWPAANDFSPCCDGWRAGLEEALRAESAFTSQG